MSSTPSLPIYFHTEPPLIFNVPKETIVQQWLKNVITTEGQTLTELNFIFCTDDYLHQMNVQYLQHDTLTDVITFDNSEEEATQSIEGDIFISVERVRENAQQFGVSEQTELYRVMVHGVLHLLGYTDKTSKAQQQMRAKEDVYLFRLLDV